MRRAAPECPCLRLHGMRISQAHSEHHAVPGRISPYIFIPPVQCIGRPTSKFYYADIGYEV